MRLAASAAENIAESTATPSLTGTVIYTPAERGARREGTNGTRFSGRAVHRQVLPRHTPRRDEESSVSSSEGDQGRMRASRLNEEARVNIRRIIMTLTLLLSEDGHARVSVQLQEDQRTC
jgi:hypothetical protein